MTRKEQRNQVSKEYGRKNPYKEYLGPGSIRYDYDMPAEHFIKGSEWADAHPNWISVEDELPPIDRAIAYKFSKKVLVSDGEHIHASRYSYNTGEWLVVDIIVTHWMPLPNLPEK